MLAKQTGIVLCRVGAVVLTVQVITSVGYSVGGLFFGGFGFDSEFLALAVVSAVPGLAAIGLWLFAERICDIPSARIENSQPDITGTIDVIRIGTMLIGVYVLVTGITDAASVETASWLLPDASAETRQVHIDIAGRRAAYLAKLLLGTALVLGRNRIADLLRRLKYAGARK